MFLSVYFRLTLFLSFFLYDLTRKYFYYNIFFVCSWPTLNFSNIKSNLIFSCDLHPKLFCVSTFECLSFFTSTFFSPLSKVAFFNLLLFNSASKQKKCEIPVVVSFVLDAKISFRWNAWNMKMIKMRNNKKLTSSFFRPNNSTCSDESGSESWVWNDHSVSGHAKKYKTKSFAEPLRMLVYSTAR